MRRVLFAVLVAIAASAHATPPPSMISVTDVVPRHGRPHGGELVRINGYGFTEPVRVFFDLGLTFPVEAFIVHVTPRTIDLITPAIFLGEQQQLVADLVIHSEAGTVWQQRTTVEQAFTYRNAALTPKPVVATPNVSPVRGGTIVSIFGEGFEMPVQILFRRDGFGPMEARVIRVDYDQIVVEAPDSSAFDDASGALFDIEIVNINANRRGVLRDAFRYMADPLIAQIAPSVGPAAGGTTLRIIGSGFYAPVHVTVAGIAAEVKQVSSTEIVVKTGAATVARCSVLSGPIVITSLLAGATTTGPSFTYFGPRSGCTERQPPTRAEQ